MKVKLFGIGGKNLTNKLPFPQANCLQILVESPSKIRFTVIGIFKTKLFNAAYVKLWFPRALASITYWWLVLT
jgi:hypothetical protein